MNELIKLTEYPVNYVLNKLLQDKSTKENIVFATDNYRLCYGTGYSEHSYMTVQTVRGFASCNIQPRVYKSAYEQNERTRKKAEVFTPTWVVNKMNNFCDTEWFRRENVFNTENDTSWDITDIPVEFPEGKCWQDYVDSRRLEITCGEAPYITSRYDTTTGEILPFERRIGILDRKLRVVGENTNNENDWLKWAIRAVESVYGYEFQGDNLLIARINVLSTFCDYLENKWHRQATKTELCTVANIISWNFWQMDGLNGIAPFGSEHEECTQLSLMGKPSDSEEVKCSVYDWRSKRPVTFEKFEERGKGMKFDYVIGNPPYQEEQISTDIASSQKNFAPPVYHLFMDAAYEVGNKVMLIHPARFLFKAGSTPKNWNEKMLNDEHFKIVYYDKDSTNVFKNADIKGGIAISFRDNLKNFGAISTFTPYQELNKILKIVKNNSYFKSMEQIVFSRTSFRLTKKVHEDYPNAKDYLSEGHLFDMASNIFQRLPFLFHDSPIDDGKWVKVLGRDNNNRIYKYIKAEYINEGKNLNSYKLYMPQASGVGEFGETFGVSVLCEPNVASTETFISIGNFATREEAENCLKYISTKFLRSLVSILKVTQNTPPAVWKYVPLQNFTSQSDIDWSRSIPEIDKQLYAKYGLSQEEIDFIETHVKEME